MLVDFLRFSLPTRPEAVERRILRLIRSAYETVPYYRSLLDEHRLRPDDFRSLRDYIDHFPATPAEAYRRIQAEDPGAVLSRRFRESELLTSRTSGSSGNPLVIRRTRREAAHNNAKTIWHLVHVGLRPWDRVLAIVPTARVVRRDYPLQRLGIFYRRTVDFSTPVEEVVDLMLRERLNGIYGTRAHILLIAEAYRRRAAGRPLRFLMAGSERITAACRRQMLEAFRPTHYGEHYGATEMGIVATRRGEGDYEVNYRSAFFSLADPVQLDDRTTAGSILLTSLYSEAQPFLKYRIGDTVRVRDYDRLHELKATITAIEGRDNDYLRLPGGGCISAPTLYTPLETLPFLRQFRVVQDRLDHCDVLIRLGEDAPEHRDRVAAEVRRLLGEKIAYTIHYVDAIPPDPNGKAKVLISKVPPTGTPAAELAGQEA